MNSKVLLNKSAIVTGAAQGIGREIALRFAREGAAVTVVDKDGTGAARTAREIAEQGGTGDPFDADVADASAVEKMVERTLAGFGRVDILINNAALIGRAPLLDTTLAHWNEVLAVNLTGAFLCAREVAKAMREQGAGRIVNVASHAGLRGSRNRAAYTASKGGLLALTRAMAVELADYGITVNAIAPGSIATGNLERMEPARRAAWERAIPLRRHGTSGELAAVALFLASDEASYVTGQTIAVDGGFTIAGLSLEG